MKLKYLCGVLLTIPTAAFNLSAHDVAYGHIHAPATPATPLQQVEETTGPIEARTQVPRDQQMGVSGQGYWRFVAVDEGMLPLPDEIRPFIEGAHGTIVVDEEKDIIYWGLEKVGWVAFSDRLSKSWVVEGDPMLASGNLHGADLFQRPGQLPIIAAADNVEGEVYLMDTTFANAQKLDWPQNGPYENKGQYHPTDVAFTKEGEFYVTDGYGQAFFMKATTGPLQYEGTFIGGKDFSRTPHGITYAAEDASLLVSARPEAEIKGWVPATQEWLETMGLPPGSTVCDVDLWGDYALAPCLDGPDQTPGPIYIINRKTKTIASVLRPKEDLGFDRAQHIHDAAWYITGEGDEREVYVLFTNWNPGGIGAIKLVGTAE